MNDLADMVRMKSIQMCTIEPLSGNWYDFVDIFNMLAKIGSGPPHSEILSLESPLPRLNILKTNFQLTTRNPAN